MAETAEVTIIGGGIVGTSIAYHLARQGCRRVVLLEKDVLGAGSTSKAAGGIRAQFSSELAIRMSLYAKEFFLHLEEELGVPADFKQVGYLFLLASDQELETFRRNVAFQNRLGVDSRLITVEEVSEIFPAVKTDDLVGAAFCPSDGFAGPAEVLQAFADGARRLGVDIREGTEALSIELAGGRVQAVRTNRGAISTPVVVNAAGPWAALVGRMVDIRVPVTPLRRHYWATEPFPEIPGPTPLTVDFRTGFICRKELDGIMLSGGDMKESWDFDTTIDWRELEKATDLALRRVPILEKARVMRGWAGLREVTPDQAAVLGRVPGVEGFICANGFSGHGFMHSPATGRLIAELILDGHTFLDISPLSIERFAGREAAAGVLAAHPV